MAFDRRSSVLFGACLFAFATPATAQERIRDNLFLLEEAYNQEPGVIQHISLFQMVPRTREWSYSFTEEWPVPTDRHQLSVTLQMSGPPDHGRASFGDLLLNYRLQVLGIGGTGPVAMAPRLSLVLPTGSAERGTGRGAIGVQLNLPVSIEVGPYFVFHLNAGMTVTPSAHAPGLRTETALDASAGMALVSQPLSWLNPLVEVSYLDQEELTAAGSHRVRSITVSPGLRAAIDVSPIGLQIVPGVAVPFTMTPAAERGTGVIGYLSFEHPAFSAGPGAER